MCLKKCMGMKLLTESYEKLSKDDLCVLMELMHDCLRVCSVDNFHKIILDYSSYLGFEYVLLCNSLKSYPSEKPLYLDNLSNPVQWMIEYDKKGYFHRDPVRYEIERRLATGNCCSVVLWDAYDAELSDIEHEIIERRCQYGLKYGFSAYANSGEKDKFFLISMASSENEADERILTIAELIVPHLMMSRKRLDLQELVGGFTKKEQQVAEWLSTGKTNWEIANILGITERTVKYHTANIFKKLNVQNRKQAVTILQAIRYLCV